MKKHLSMAAMLIAFAGGALASKKKPTKEEQPTGTDIVMSPADYKSSQRYLIEELSFAGETVPFENGRVYEKFLGHVDKRANAHFIDDLQEKTAQWFPIIEPILAQYGIPEDFKYLPAIESGFKAKARSHVGAGGYWQFMPATAKQYGLLVNRKVDERTDMVKSTIAAARFLNDMYERLGSWTLVAAAYNFGQGALGRTMDKQDERDYFMLKLNKETGDYVYKLLAFKHLNENANDYHPAGHPSFFRMENLQYIGSIGLAGLSSLGGLLHHSHHNGNGEVQGPQPLPGSGPAQYQAEAGRKSLIKRIGDLFNRES